MYRWEQAEKEDGGHVTVLKGRMALGSFCHLSSLLLTTEYKHLKGINISKLVTLLCGKGPFFRNQKFSLEPSGQASVSSFPAQQQSSGPAGFIFAAFSSQQKSLLKLSN